MNSKQRMKYQLADFPIIQEIFSKFSINDLITLRKTSKKMREKIDNFILAPTTLSEMIKQKKPQLNFFSTYDDLYPVKFLAMLQSSMEQNPVVVVLLIDLINSIHATQFIRVFKDLFKDDYDKFEKKWNDEVKSIFAENEVLHNKYQERLKKYQLKKSDYDHRIVKGKPDYDDLNADDNNTLSTYIQRPIEPVEPSKLTVKVKMNEETALKIICYSLTTSNFSRLNQDIVVEAIDHPKILMCAKNYKESILWSFIVVKLAMASGKNNTAEIVKNFSELRKVDMHINLNGINFSQINFSNQNLLPNLRCFRLSGLILQEANFSNLDLMLTDFSYADLRGANFTNAKLQSANFRSADLRGAIFNGADLSQVDFSDAEFEGIKIDKDTKLAGAVFLSAAAFKDIKTFRAALDKLNANVSTLRKTDSKLQAPHSKTSADLLTKAIALNIGQTLIKIAPIYPKLARDLLLEATSHDLFVDTKSKVYLPFLFNKYDRYRFYSPGIRNLFLNCENIFDANDSYRNRNTNHRAVSLSNYFF